MISSSLVIAAKKELDLCCKGKRGVIGKTADLIPGPAFGAYRGVSSTYSFWLPPSYEDEGNAVRLRRWIYPGVFMLWQHGLRNALGGEVEVVIESKLFAQACECKHDDFIYYEGLRVWTGRTIAPLYVARAMGVHDRPRYNPSSGVTENRHELPLLRMDAVFRPKAHDNAIRPTGGQAPTET